MPKHEHAYITNDLVLYRERLGFTQHQVARLIGLSNVSLISKLEQGQRFPHLKTALKLAALYRVPVDFLYSTIYRSAQKEISGRDRHTTCTLGSNIRNESAAEVWLRESSDHERFVAASYADCRRPDC